VEATTQGFRTQNGGQMMASSHIISGENLFPDFAVKVSDSAPLDNLPEVVIYADLFTDEQLKRIRVVDGGGDTWELNLPF
jgi:hypothetical protein